ncbi:MAG: extracellular solute-binding protein [Proteobacteria bacterium]|nr:extracellular solute-binding protein [Pseudomonadota bacterium]
MARQRLMRGAPRGFLALLAAVLALVLPGQATAQEQRALAMFGDTAHPEGITEPLPWVRPGAAGGCSLRLGEVGTFDTMNPYIVLGLPARGLGLVYESLMARSPDEPFTLYPLIAQDVELAPDRSSITFHLDPRARFQDGTPVTPADVLYSFENLRDHGKPHTRTYYGAVTRAFAPDASSVRFELAPGNWEMPLILGLMPVLSRAWFERVGFERTSLEAPMGTGPYRVETIVPGSRVVYRRDPGYWARDLPITAGHNNFETIVYQWFRDANVALQAFKAGDLDVRFEDDAARWATGYEGPALAQGRFVMEEFAHGRPSGLEGIAWNERRAPFGDVRVREALGLAFDFAWTNRNLLYGQYRRTTSLFDNSPLAARGPAQGAERALIEPFRDSLPAALFEHPFAWPTTDGSGRLRENLKQAALLLEQVGFVLRDGRLVDGDGRPLAFEILLGSPAWERILLPYVANLKKLGIEARLRTVDAAQFQTRIENFDFDALVWRWGVSLSPGNEQAIYWGSAAADQPGSRNYAGIRDPAVDALIAALVDARSRDELVATARALDRVLMWGRHVLPFYFSSNDDVARWQHIARPQRTPLYGIDITTWYCNEN